MKVICEYCDSYVEVEDSPVCPMCGGPLGDAIRAAEERIRREQAEAEAREAEKLKAQQEAAAKQQKNELIKDVALNAVGVLLGGGIAAATQPVPAQPVPMQRPRRDNAHGPKGPGHPTGRGSAGRHENSKSSGRPGRRGR